MSELVVEITLPSSVLTKVPQSSDSWEIFFGGDKDVLQIQNDTGTRSWVKHHTWRLSGEHKPTK